jgi:hypothetical protein
LGRHRGPHGLDGIRKHDEERIAFGPELGPTARLDGAAKDSLVLFLYRRVVLAEFLE